MFVRSSTVVGLHQREWGPVPVPHQQRSCPWHTQLPRNLAFQLSSGFQAAALQAARLSQLGAEMGRGRLLPGMLKQVWNYQQKTPLVRERFYLSFEIFLVLTTNLLCLLVDTAAVCCVASVRGRRCPSSSTTCQSQCESVRPAQMF